MPGHLLPVREEIMSVTRTRPEFTIRTNGDWCGGYYWEIVRLSTGATIKESGPYHGESGRKWAFDDAVDYAFRNDLTLDSEHNPH